MSRWGKFWTVVLLAGLAALAIWFVRGRLHEGESAGANAATGGGDKSAGKSGEKSGEKSGDDHGGAKSGKGGPGGGADRAIPVLIAHAEARDVPIYLEGLGSVTAYKTVNVKTLVDGLLEKVDFREGQSVRRGELLAEVDSRPFTIQLHMGEAALARDTAQLQGAQRNLDRYIPVAAQKLIPQQQVDDQRALTEQLQGTVRTDQAQIESARLQLVYARITSPVDGITGIRLVDPGNVIHAADPNGIVIVTQIDPIAVIFTLPQDDLPRIAPRQAEGPLLVEAMSRDGGQMLATGELALIDNQINQNTATIRLKAIFPNPQHTLWPNQFVKTRMRLRVQKGALVIPAACIQRGPQGTFVYVVAADGQEENRASIRPIEVETIEGDNALISKGLKPGEQVVSEGQNQLRPDARVSIRHAGAPGGGAPGGGAPGGSAPGGAGGAHGHGAKKPAP